MIGLDIKLYYKNGWWYNWTLNCMEKKIGDDNWTLNSITKMSDDMFGHWIILQKWWQYDLVKVINGQENWVLIWNILLEFRGMFEVEPVVKRAHSTRASGTCSLHDIFLLNKCLA